METKDHNKEPECYIRHSEIDGHIKEGKFWRGVIITVTLSGITIFIGQYNMSIQNNEKIVALTSRLSVIAEANVKRLDRLEDMLFSLKGLQGKTGETGATGATGSKGDRGLNA